MKESCNDGITVRIVYEPRLARVVVSEEQAKEIEKYYQLCAEEGSTEEQIEKSKRAMSKMSAILAHPERLKKLATDIITHYEILCHEKPEVTQKAMIVCADRKIAFKVLQEIISIRPDWGLKKKSDNEKKLSKNELDRLLPLSKINLVATQGQNDEPELFKICGTKEYRQRLAEQFKNNDSNFKIAIVVDMWITGFDVPSLSVMYIDKPLQKHTLIQTISRVNRIFDGKDKGLIVDYIGFKNDMMAAVKRYGDSNENPVDELKVALMVFREQLQFINKLFIDFDSQKFYTGTPLERLNCLNLAAEYIQSRKDTETSFMELSKKLKASYTICFPSGELKNFEVVQSQFFLAIRSIIYKQTKENAPDAEMMNIVVEKMVQDAISCTGIENIVNTSKSINLFDETFEKELSKIKMPITKFNALLKVLRKTIIEYEHENKVQSMEFDRRLRKIVDEYNSRDNLKFTSDVVADFVNELSDKLIEIMKDLDKGRNHPFEGKVFFDILVKVRNEHNFDYADEKCLILAKEIKALVDDKSKFKISWR